MRFRLALGPLVCAIALCAQAVEDPEVARARAGIEKLKALVEAGAVPRSQLERAQEAFVDVQDAAFLRRTLYGPDLTEDLLDDMMGAAARRLDRRNQELEKAQQLVREGVASQLSLGTFLEEVDRARKEYDLAASRARLCRELTLMARAEQALQTDLEQAPAAASLSAERYDGDGIFTPRDFNRIEMAFQGHFDKPLPVSALGETAVHRALGFDHRNRVDVALHPDQPEGVWLRQYLTTNHIPFFAFRQAVPHKATGAHIHIGPMSARLASGG